MAPSSSPGAALPRTSIVGADGLLGRALRDLLEERVDDLALVPARACDGSGDLRPLLTDPLAPRLAFLAIEDDRARRVAAVLVEAGCLVLDFSAAHRLDPTVPLLVADLLERPLPPPRGLVAMPNCTNPGLATVLDALGRAGGGLAAVRVHSVQSASGGGRRMLASLEDPDGALTADVLPAIGPLDAHGRSAEEAAVVEELRRLLGDPGLDLAASCLRVPTAVGHGMTVELRCREPLTPAQARKALAAVPTVRLHDRPPSPRRLPDPDAIHLGRVRAVDPDRPAAGLMLWMVVDNLRQGAATNAVAVAEALLAAEA